MIKIAFVTVLNLCSWNKSEKSIENKRSDVSWFLIWKPDNHLLTVTIKVNNFNT